MIYSEIKKKQFKKAEGKIFSKLHGPVSEELEYMLVAAFRSAFPALQRFDL